MKKINPSKLCKLYSKGMSLRTIAKIENISINTVKKYLLKEGVKVRTQNLVYELKNDDDLLIGTFIGIWAGDGTKYLDKGYRIKIFGHLKDKELTEFIQEVLIKLFGKKSKAINENGNRIVIKFKSKFIYNYVDNYLDYSRNKTHTVHLKKEIEKYSNKFQKGFFLGLMLSDGYLKNKFYFNSTSNLLAENMIKILRKFNFTPKKYIHKREKYNWKDLNMVSLNSIESKDALKLLDDILKEIEYYSGFSRIKGYKEKMAPP